MGRCRTRNNGKNAPTPAPASRKSVMLDVPGNDAWCYLKSNPAFCPEGMTDSSGEKGPWKKNEATISGGENIIPYKGGAINNAESGGDPIPELPQGQKGEGWQKCQTFCGTYDDCKSWSYVYSTDWCWLKGTNVMEMPWNYTPDV